MTRGQATERVNRDRARTPMHWDASPGGGFTTGQPWLPVGDAAARNVAAQRGDPGSVLWLCRRLLELRRAELGGQIAPYELVAAEADGLWAYRCGGLLVLANLSGQPRTWPVETGEILLSTSGDPVPGTPGQPDGLTLRPWQGVITR
jgi:glycosidase